MASIDVTIRDAGWSSLVAREAHNLEVAGSNPAPAMSFRRQASSSARRLSLFTAPRISTPQEWYVFSYRPTDASKKLSGERNGAGLADRPFG